MFFLLFLEQVQFEETNYLGTTDINFGEAQEKAKHGDAS